MAELRFECTECGECCRQRGRYAYVYVNEEECGELAAHLGLELAAFKKAVELDKDVNLPPFAKKAIEDE